ncbi:uncharacterized protein METZ01_LOCUS301732 [marine metagenome]|uniref:Uncharacterized protein n=1 Tax=marine metagenome TaxID=408172 RepID=A0A382MK62_9ZZZZ
MSKIITIKIKILFNLIVNGFELLLNLLFKTIYFYFLNDNNKYHYH